jgi:peptidoglycan hydrolase-like protein with peptidoglycan-binding domain
MGYETFASDPARAVIDPSGFYQLRPNQPGRGLRVSRRALRDPDAGLAARFSQYDAEQAVARLGGGLPTDAEWREIARVAHWIAPVVLRETPEEKAEREAKGLGLDHSLDKMSTREWCEREDTKVDAEIATSGWDGNLPLLNEGKVKILRTSAEHAVGANVNDGWDLDPRPEVVDFIQPRSTAHRDGQDGKVVQRDYSEKTWIVFHDDLPSDPPYTGPLATGAAGIESPTPARAVPQEATPPTISRKWARMDLTIAWQRAMGIVPADGIFGPATEAKTKAFQAAHGVEADGIVGPKTWALLKVAPALPTPTPPKTGGDIPGIAFTEAAHYRKSNATRPVIWAVVHDAECSIALTGAEALAEYGRITDRNASWHFAVDPNSATQSVRINDVAWAAGTTGNAYGVHVEFCGFYRTQREEWTNELGMAELKRGADIFKVICQQYGIPFELLSVEDIRAKRSGIVTHALLTEAFHESDHQDPGPNFPMDIFLGLLKAA